MPNQVLTPVCWMPKGNVLAPDGWMTGWQVHSSVGCASPAVDLGHGWSIIPMHTLTVPDIQHRQANVVQASVATASRWNKGLGGKP